MKFISFFLPIQIAWAITIVTGAEHPLRAAVECLPRQGLPHFISKAAAGKSVKIAYLGGSITAAPGWRVQSRQWFQEQYPDTVVEEIHAAIGGTGSDLGVFRLERDVLVHRPDLLFVEFAVNDGGSAPDRILKAMEGIVRQARSALPELDICFVYTLRDTMVPDLLAGHMPQAASVMEQVADHYDLPSIHFGVEVVRLEKEGKLIFKAEKSEDPEPVVFSTDGVHPLIETGHRIYTETIARSWPSIVQASGPAARHGLKEALRPDHWEKARLVAIRPDMLMGDWKKLPRDHDLAKKFERNMPELYQATAPGAKLRFRFEGISAGVFDLLGPDGGQLIVQLDGAEAVKRNRIDSYCTYHRMAKLDLALEVKPGLHEVEITLTPEQLDKRAILFEKNREDFDKHPEKYREHTWYPAALMLIGEIK